MSIKFLRAPSETPSINNTDDFVGLRYSYGDQSGYVKSKGSEIGHQVNGSTFRVLSGRIVVQGVECDIDANGYDVLVDSIATERYHTVYLQVSLSTMTAQILQVYDTVSFPVVSPGDNLTSNITGTARLELYHFKSQNGVISQVNKLIKPIDYIGHDLSVSTSKLQDQAVTEDKLAADSVSTEKIQDYSVTNAKLSGAISKSKLEVGILNDYNTSKGTIEERLTSLGFSEGNATDLSGVSSVTLKKLGKFVICKFTPTSSIVSFTLPVGFRPYSNIEAYSSLKGVDSATGRRDTYGFTKYVITSGGSVTGSSSIESSIAINRSQCIVGWSTDSNYPV